MINNMKKIILFGAGVFGKTIAEKIKDKFTDRLLFCDNDKEKYNTVICGIQVINFFDMKNLCMRNEVDRIVISTKDKSEIINQCVSENIDPNILFYYDKKLDTLKPICEMYANIIYSQDGEEFYLRERFENKKDGFYVDIGANHPYRFSNTYWAYLQGWRGINVEPDLINYELLKYIRNKDININCGISEQESQMDYYMFRENAFNTFCANEINNINNDIVGVKKIQVRRLDTIFDEYNVKHIDFIDIDVEGMEMNVLRSIDWIKTSIDCILVEQRRMTLLDVVQSEVCIFLESKGYVPVSKYNRTVIYEKQ